MQAAAPAIGEVKRLYEWLREHRPQTDIIFLSGRRRAEQYATVDNLASAGFVGYSKLIVRKASDHESVTGSVADYKLEQRRQLVRPQRVSGLHSWVAPC